MCLFSRSSSKGLEKAMAAHSSTLVWKIPWTEEPSRLWSMGSLRVRHDWVTSLSLFTFMHWRRKWQPTPVFLPGEPQEGGAWWAAVYGVTQSQTWLKRLSSSSSSKGLGSRLLLVTIFARAFQVALAVKNLPPNAGDKRSGFDPWVRKIPWRQAWQSTPVFLPGDSHEQRSLVGYSS